MLLTTRFFDKSITSTELFPNAATNKRRFSRSTAMWSMRPSTFGNGIDCLSRRGSAALAYTGSMQTRIVTSATAPPTPEPILNVLIRHVLWKYEVRGRRTEWHATHSASTMSHPADILGARPARRKSGPGTHQLERTVAEFHY